MKPEWRRFAPIGLIIALVAALAAMGLYFIQRQWNIWLQVSLVLIVVGLAAFVILDPDRVRRAFTGRQARYGSNSLILTLAFLGILIVINWVVYQNTQRWDLTENQEFTLAPETIFTLESLPEPVMAQAFFTASMNPDRTANARDLLEQYKFDSNGTFDYEFIDPNENPALAEQSKITRDGTVVVNMGGHQEQVQNITEQELTGALVRLLSPEQRKVYFLTGHGEYSPDDTGEQSYSLIKRALEAKNYTVEMLSLLATNQIPDDAVVIVVAGPRVPLSSDEVKLLGGFVASGGALIAMQEPLPVTQFGDSPDPFLDYLSETWGIVYGGDMVVDMTSNNPFAPYAAQYGNHSITQKLQNLSSQFPTARSVRVENQVEGVSQVELVLTSPQSWSETNLEGLVANPPDITFDESDGAGPVTIVSLAENFETNARVVVFGDSDFVIDVNFPAYANSDLFINSVDWAAGQEELINLTPKERTDRVVVPPQASMMNLILLATVILIPGLTLVAGIVLFIQKRRRG